MSGLMCHGACHLIEDGFGGLGGVWGVGDGAAYDEVAGAHAQGFGWRGGALLVTGRASGGTDSGDDEGALRACEGAERGDLLRRADEASDSGVEAHAGEEFDLLGRGAVEADGGDLGFIHAGEDGDGEELRWIGDAGEGFAGGGDHGRAAGGVDGEHVDPEARGGAHCAGNGVGDIVKLEVEEDLVAAAQEGFEHGRAGGDEEFEADFEPGACVVKAVNEDGGGGGIGHVQSNDEALPGGFAGISEGGEAGSAEGRIGIEAWHT